MNPGKGSILFWSAALILLSTTCQPCHAALTNGTTSLCQCTPRNTTGTTYLDSLNSYTADMVELLSEISTQLASLGLKFSDFSSSVLTKLLQISGAVSEATRISNALLASLNGSSSSSDAATTATTTPSCTIRDSLDFFGSTVYEALGSGGTYSGSKWTVALTGGALTIDYGVRSCTNQTQYIQQICVDGHPSQVYVFIQASTASSASLVAESLTVSSQTGAICIPIGQNIMAFTVLPRSLKSSYSLMPSYQFALNVAGCFSAIPSGCTPTIAPTTPTPCTDGNAFADVNLLPVNFYYNAHLSRIYGFVINATTSSAASEVFLADLTADGCRREPNVTQVCATGNFRRMKIGHLLDYQGNIEEFPGSENATASKTYQRFCYTLDKKVAILAILPEELFTPSEMQFRFFPEARGCFEPLSSDCVARPPCVGPLEVGWHSEQLPQQSFTATNMTYTGGQWTTTGSGASLAVDMSAGGCRKTAAVTQVCVTSTNANQVILNAIFPVGEAQFVSSNTLSGSAPPTAASPWCQTYSEAPTMQTLYISFSEYTSPVSLKWNITGCFKALPAYCLTTTAAPVSTTVTTTVRPTEACTSGFPTITNSDSNIPATAISGGTFESGTNSWTVAKGSSLTFDLTVAGCRQSATLLAICILGNAATVRVDYVLEDNTRVILSNSATESQPATGTALCFTFPSLVHAKSLVLLPTALKTASLSDTAYSLKVNLSACYSAISPSCYNPICGCTDNYRPVFYNKKYYSISFKVVSGDYSVYKSSYASPVTEDYQNLLYMTDTMTWQNFGDYKDKYEGIDQVTFKSGSVDFSARLIMHDGGYSASALDAALTAGMTSYTAGGTYVVNGTTIVITDITSSTTNISTTTAPTLASSSIDTTLLLALLIPLCIVLILLIVLLILLCKYCRCCCFASTDSVHAGVKTSMQEAGTATSTAELIDPLEKSEPLQSAREENYQYTGGATDNGQVKIGSSELPMPQQQQQQQQQQQADDTDEDRRRRRRKKNRRSTVAPFNTEEDGAAAAAATAGEAGAATNGLMFGAQPVRFARQPSEPTRPNTPKTVSIETFTYQLRQPGAAAEQQQQEQPEAE